MDFLKNQLARVQEQVSQLTPSQKMLAGALVIITVMSLYYWTTFAGRADMEVLINQPMPADQMAAAMEQLRAQHIEAKAVGDRIHINSGQKIDALAALGSVSLLPEDTRNAFDEIISKASPFTTHSMEDRMFLHAKEVVLAQAIKKMPRVAYAMVVIDPTHDRGPAGAQPSATLSIMLRPGAVGDQKMANMLGDFVSGGVARLKRSRIKVQINERTYGLKDKDDQSPNMAGEDWLARKQEVEKYYADKVKEQFGFIEGVFVTVSCKVNNEHTEKRVESIDPKTVVQKAVRESTTTEENASATKNGGEPGVVANSPGSAETVSTGDKVSGTSEKNDTDYIVAIPKTEVKTLNFGGDSALTGVSVLFPRSYFIQVYKSTSRSDKEPDPTVLATFISTQLSSMREVVKGWAGPLPDEALAVRDYVDSLPTAGALPVVAATPISLAITDHGKEIALGALALVSLFMVFNMVKRGSGAPVAVVPMAHGVSPRGPLPLQGREEAVGEAMEGDTLLDGMELDEESAKAQQMLNQVSEMVEENPDAAANLVKRWMNRA